MEAEMQLALIIRSYRSLQKVEGGKKEVTEIQKPHSEEAEPPVTVIPSQCGQRPHSGTTVCRDEDTSWRARGPPDLQHRLFNAPHKSRRNGHSFVETIKYSAGS